MWRAAASRAAPAASALALALGAPEPAPRCLERRLQDSYHLLEPERPLGVGGHGVVFPGVNKSSGEIMAIKQVSKKHMSAKAAETLSRRVKDEAELLRIAGEHRSICSYKEIFEGADAWYIVTELARGGELFDRLVERGAYTANGAASVMREVVDAVAYLHSMGIAHLDLKPENVLLKSDETDASDVRLVDFGSARGSDRDRGGGTHPFDANNDADDAEVTRRVLAGAAAAGAFEGPEWGRVPGAVRELLEKLLASDPAARPATEVLGHAWLRDPDGRRSSSAEEAASSEAALESLRQFHRGRRRFKAMLLAVMIGHADGGLKRDRGEGTKQRRTRVIQRRFNLSEKEAQEMLRAVARRDDPMPGARKKTGVAATGIYTERLRHMLPPLYPAHRLNRGDLVFSAGETDPAFYILLGGDVLISHSFLLRPRSGFAGAGRSAAS
ncbi:serine/threonine kinase [Aureococcus anophagefferens]|nr:serine/threonine kinase [Aureococcus anophagefferens]